MSIKIEVTGNSIPEVADKLIAIGTSLRNTAINDTDNAAREALQAKRDAAKAQVAAEADAQRVAASVEKIVNRDEGKVEEATPSAPEGTTTEAATTLTLDDDITPRVIKLVAVKGRAAVESLLSEYGVARASQVDIALWPELVARLDAELS